MDNLRCNKLQFFVAGCWLLDIIRWGLRTVCAAAGCCPLLAACCLPASDWQVPGADCWLLGTLNIFSSDFIGPVMLSVGLHLFDSRQKTSLQLPVSDALRFCFLLQFSGTMEDSIDAAQGFGSVQTTITKTGRSDHLSSEGANKCLHTRPPVYLFRLAIKSAHFSWVTIFGFIPIPPYHSVQYTSVLATLRGVGN